MHSEGFKSYQVEDYVQSFKENGYVVIEDVLGSNEIKHSVNEVRLSLNIVLSEPMASLLSRFGNTLRKTVMLDAIVRGHGGMRIGLHKCVKTEDSWALFRTGNV